MSEGQESVGWYRCQDRGVPGCSSESEWQKWPGSEGHNPCVEQEFRFHLDELVGFTLNYKTERVVLKNCLDVQTHAR